MKNIFVEGIQGSGKSMLINNIVKFNPELHGKRSISGTFSVL